MDAPPSPYPGVVLCRLALKMQVVERACGSWQRLCGLQHSTTTCARGWLYLSVLGLPNVAAWLHFLERI